MSLPGRGVAPSARVARWDDGRVDPDSYPEGRKCVAPAAIWQAWAGPEPGSAAKSPESERGRALGCATWPCTWPQTRASARRPAASVDEREQQEARHEAPEMRVPGDRGALGPERQGDDAEQQVGDEPDPEEHHGGAVAQQLRDALE